MRGAKEIKWGITNRLIRNARKRNGRCDGRDASTTISKLETVISGRIALTIATIITNAIK